MSKRSVLELLADMSAVVEGNPAKAMRMAADEIVSLREQVEKLTAALKLAREALKFDGYPCGTGCKCIACEALAAIDALRGE